MNCKEIKENVSIRTVLESFNLFPVKENHKTAFYLALDRDEKIPSLSVNFVKNRAFDFGTGKSYDVISIVQQMKQCSVSEALKYLEALDYLGQFDFSVRENQLKSENLNEKPYEILNVSEVRHPALIQYLESRKVIEQKHLVKEIRYKMNDKRYFGIGFFNNSDGLEIRNLYSKICLGKKNITLIKNENLNNEIAIFEGFFDYLTYRNLEQSDHSTSDFLILNSTAMLFKAEELLKDYDKIYLFLDNDSNGKYVTSIIINQYKNVEDCSLLYRNFKDLNEWYCKE